MNQGKIIISRKSQIVNFGRGFTIFIESQKVGRIYDGETKIFEFEPGLKEIFVKIDWCKTTPIKFDLKANQTINLEAGSNINDKKIFFGYSPHYYLFKPSEFLYLKQNLNIDNTVYSK